MENLHNLLKPCFINFDGQFNQINHFFAKILGYSVAELQTVNLLKLVHPEDYQTTQHTLTFLRTSWQSDDIQEQDVYSFENRCQHKNGSYRWLLWIMIPQRHGIYAKIIDIHKYKKFVSDDTPFTSSNSHLPSHSTHLEVSSLGEETAQLAYERLLLIVDSLEAIVYVTDMETYEILYMNKYGKTIFGNVVGKICWQVFWGGPSCGGKSTLCTSCCQNNKVSPLEHREGQTQVWECHHLQKERWHSVHTCVIRWVNGRLVRLAIAYDITERQLIEQNLKLNQERYALAVGAGKTGVWDWNIHTQEFYLDPSLKTLLGYSNEELPNRLEAWMKLIHPQDVERIRQASRDYLHQRIPRFEAEHRLLHKDGSIHWMIVRGTAMYDEHGHPYRMVGTNTDITERKKVEERLHEQDRLLRGATQITHTLLTVPNYDKAISIALETVGHLMSVDRVYIFENHLVNETEEIVINQRFTWINGEYKPYNTPYKLKNLSYAHYLPGWYDILNENQPIIKFVKDFSQPTRSLLESYQVISILIVPIHFNGQFWGFMGLDDCHKEREWDQYDIFILRLIGDSIRGALARQQAKESLYKSELKFRTIIENNRDAILIIDKQGIIHFANPAAEKLYKVPCGGLIGKNFCAPLNMGDKTEFSFFDVEGHHHHGELQISEIEWEGETLLVISLRDITDRKQAAEELQRAKEAADEVTALFQEILPHAKRQRLRQFSVR